MMLRISVLKPSRSTSTTATIEKRWRKIIYKEGIDSVDKTYRLRSLTTSTVAKDRLKRMRMIEASDRIDRINL